MALIWSTTLLVSLCRWRNFETYRPMCRVPNYNKHSKCELFHGDVTKMEPFSVLLALWVGSQRSQVNSPQKDQWSGALMFFLTCAGINGPVNNREAGDLRQHRTHYDVPIIPYSLGRNCIIILPWFESNDSCYFAWSLTIPVFTFTNKWYVLSDLNKQPKCWLYTI